MNADPSQWDYVRQLESVVRGMLTPLKNVPFNLVIEAVTGHRIIDFDAANDKHRRILEALTQAGKGSVVAIQADGGIACGRPNEVGNRIESYVKDALKAISVKADTPTTKTGKRKAAGYPDIAASIEGVSVYLECKTYNRKTIHTTQRSFYFSPSQASKVTCDALHFVLAFEIVRASNGRYLANGFKLLSLERLPVDVKYEFNADNRRLYGEGGGLRLLYSETGMLR